jgi:bifunctional non-homologous end joining protein LigD
MLQRLPFIVPSVPVLKPSPPTGPGWLHEIKFDGWRAQLTVDGEVARVLSRNGNDITKRFADIRIALASLPCRSVIIDAEIVVCATDGKPDFGALMAGQREGLCAWCFDMMELDGRDLRPLPLSERKAQLRNLLIRADEETLRYSEEFPDPVKLLQVADKMGLEGIVSKKASQPYKSGRNLAWVKVKTTSWREANKGRGELFEKR